MTIRSIQFSLPVFTPLKKWLKAMQAKQGVIPYTFWASLNSKYGQPYLSVCVEDNALGRLLAYRFCPAIFWIESDFEEDYA